MKMETWEELPAAAAARQMFGSVLEQASQRSAVADREEARRAREEARERASRAADAADHAVFQAQFAQLTSGQQLLTPAEAVAVARPVPWRVTCRLRRLWRGGGGKCSGPRG